MIAVVAPLCFVLLFLYLNIQAQKYKIAFQSDIIPACVFAWVCSTSNAAARSFG